MATILIETAHPLIIKLNCLIGNAMIIIDISCTACFLSQQSAEKVLKAVMVLKGLQVIKTNDLDTPFEKMPTPAHHPLRLIHSCDLTQPCAAP